MQEQWPVGQKEVKTSHFIFLLPIARECNVFTGGLSVHGGRVSLVPSSFGGGGGQKGSKVSRTKDIGVRYLGVGYRYRQIPYLRISYSPRYLDPLSGRYASYWNAALFTKVVSVRKRREDLVSKIAFFLLILLSNAFALRVQNGHSWKLCTFSIENISKFCPNFKLRCFLINTSIKVSGGFT